MVRREKGPVWCSQLEYVFTLFRRGRPIAGVCAPAARGDDVVRVAGVRCACVAVERGGTISAFSGSYRVRARADLESVVHGVGMPARGAAGLTLWWCVVACVAEAVASPDASRKDGRDDALLARIESARREHADDEFQKNAALVRCLRELLREAAERGAV